jgi:hypothetical protein
MSQYVITIVPVIDGDEFAGPVSQTVVRIDTETGRSSVKELTLTMRAPEGSALASTELPYVDFDLLLRAFVRPDGTVVRPDGGADAGPETAPATAPRPRTTEPHTAEPRTAEPRTAQSRATTAEPGPAERTVSRKTSGTKRTASGRTGAAKAAHLTRGRAYRRTPDPAALAAAYEETGSITGVAEHFGVPVHTAQGWISRLRRRNAEEELASS